MSAVCAPSLRCRGGADTGALPASTWPAPADLHAPKLDLSHGECVDQQRLVGGAEQNASRGVVVGDKRVEVRDQDAGPGAITWAS
jgi:hypothetical protein